MVDAALERTPAAVAAHQVVRIATGYIAAAALHAAMSLDIPDRIEDVPRAVDDLAAESGVHAETLRRLLRVLAVVGVFKEVAPRTFAHTALSVALRRGGSHRDTLLWLSAPFNLRVFAETLPAVHTGVPAVDALVGEPFFERLAHDPSLACLFDDAMVCSGARTGESLLAGYDFSGVDLLVDVGGGRGHILAAVLRAHPRMRGVLVDLPHVVAGGAWLATDERIAGRWRVEEGSFFESVPVGGDAYLLAQVLHDWDDDRAQLALSTVRRALDGVDGGRLLIVELVVDDASPSTVAAFLDFSLLLTSGGRERSRSQYAALLERAGFRITRVVPLQSGSSVIEARVL